MYIADGRSEPKKWYHITTPLISINHPYKTQPLTNLRGGGRPDPPPSPNPRMQHHIKILNKQNAFASCSWREGGWLETRTPTLRTMQESSSPRLKRALKCEIDFIFTYLIMDIWCHLSKLESNVCMIWSRYHFPTAVAFPWGAGGKKKNKYLTHELHDAMDLTIVAIYAYGLRIIFML